MERQSAAGAWEESIADALLCGSRGTTVDWTPAKVSNQAQPQLRHCPVFCFGGDLKLPGIAGEVSAVLHEGGPATCVLYLVTHSRFRLQFHPPPPYARA